MKYCQGTKCHEYRTKDRIRGNKGQKSYQTRRRSEFYYADNFCSLNCQNDWLKEFGTRAINHFGRITEPKKVMCDQAWYKDYKYTWGRSGTDRTNHFLVNDLLGRRIPITEQQFDSLTPDEILKL